MDKQTKKRVAPVLLEAPRPIKQPKSERARRAQLHRARVEAGRKGGMACTEAKREAAKRRPPPPKPKARPLESFDCTCGRSDHPSTCPLGRAMRRRGMIPVDRVKDRAGSPLREAVLDTAGEPAGA